MTGAEERDRLAKLEVHVQYLREASDKHSGILEEIRDLQAQAKGGLTVGKALMSASRYVATGITGGGFVWFMQQLPRAG